VRDRSGAEIAKKYYGLLFDHQPTAKPYPSNDDLIAWAVQAGAKEADIRGPIEDGDRLPWVEEGLKAAQDAGVKVFPTVLLNGKVFEANTATDKLAKDLIAKISKAP
jgi:hypothetical protein